MTEDHQLQSTKSSVPGKRGGASSYILQLLSGNGTDEPHTNKDITNDGDGDNASTRPLACLLGCTDHRTTRQSCGPDNNKPQPWVLAWHMRDAEKLAQCLTTTPSAGIRAIAPQAIVHGSLVQPMAVNMLELALRQPNSAMLLVYSQAMDNDTGRNDILTAFARINLAAGPSPKEAKWARTPDLVLKLCIQQENMDDATTMYNFVAALVRTKTAKVRGLATPMFWDTVACNALSGSTLVHPDDDDIASNRIIRRCDRSWYWDILARCVQLLRTEDAMVPRYTLNALISMAQSINHVYARDIDGCNPNDAHLRAVDLRKRLNSKPSH